MRSPERLLVPLPGGGPVEPYRGPRVVKTLRFEDRVAEVGAAALPPSLRAALRERGLDRAVLSLIPASTVRTGGPLGPRQTLWGWWVAKDHAVAFEAERPLRRLNGRRFAPDGPFHLDLDRYELADFERRRFRSRRAGSERRGDDPDEVRLIDTEDPIDVIPAELADVVRGGQVVALRSEDGRRVKEEVYAILLRPVGSLGAVGAERKARVGAEASEGGLAEAPWRAVVLEAWVVGTSSETVTVDPAERKVSRRALGRGGAPGSTGDRPSSGAGSSP